MSASKHSSWKYIVGILGVLLTVIGWLLSSADRLPVVYRVVAPQYLPARNAYHKMMEEDAVIRVGDPGFKEIAALLREAATGNAPPIILSARTIDWGVGAVNTEIGMELQKYVPLQISFQNASPASVQIHRLEERIRDRYLYSNLNVASTTVFFIGIALSTVAVLL